MRSDRFVARLFGTRELALAGALPAAPAPALARAYAGAVREQLREAPAPPGSPR